MDPQTLKRARRPQKEFVTPEKDLQTQTGSADPDPDTFYYLTQIAPQVTSFYVNITQMNCLIFISAVGLAESQDAAWQPGLQLPIGSFKSNPDEPGKIHYEQMQLDSFVSLFVQPC